LRVEGRQNEVGSLVASEELSEERRRFTRNADDLVRCLAMKFEIELVPGLAVIPVVEMFVTAGSQMFVPIKAGDF
jgi:hypothetical protein